MLFALTAFAVPAHAVVLGPPPPWNPVTFVSATGTDTGYCWQTSPCATFQYAASVTIPGGEIDALTPGDFGGGTPLVIGGSITIDGKGIGSITSNAAQVITVNAIDAQVVLRGLSINGTPPYFGGTNAVEGINFSSIGNANLVVENCVIAGFTNYGIANVSANSSLVVRNTAIVGGAAGVYLNEGGGNTILDHVSISGASTYGVEVLGSFGTLTMNDSSIVGGAYGVNVASSAATGANTFNAVLERTTISGATSAGIYSGVGFVSVDSSTLLNNAVAIQAPSGGIRISNNNFYLNATGIECTTSAGYVETEGNSRHSTSLGIITTGGCPAPVPINHW
jgi:hypothetical protein